MRSVVSIFRHGDRTPKQKLKLKTNYSGFIMFFEDQKDPTMEIKIKHPKQLQKLLETTYECISKTQDKNVLSKLI